MIIIIIIIIIIILIIIMIMARLALNNCIYMKIHIFPV